MFLIFRWPPKIKCAGLEITIKNDSDTNIDLSTYSIDIEIMHIDSLEAYNYLRDIHGLDLIKKFETSEIDYIPEPNSKSETNPP